MDNAIISKIERGEQPTDAELKRSGLCLACRGFGYVYDPKRDVDRTCKKCDGDGMARKQSSYK